MSKTYEAFFQLVLTHLLLRIWRLEFNVVV